MYPRLKKAQNLCGPANLGGKAVLQTQITPCGNLHPSSTCKAKVNREKCLQMLFEQGQLRTHPLHPERLKLMCVEAEASFIKIPGFPQATDSVIITYW